MEKHLALLGFKVRDAVTGFEGNVVTVAFDLYGCVQAIVQPVRDPKKPNEIGESRWFDLKRLSAIGKAPVMPVPDFAIVPGGAEKPAFPRQPAR
jgi:hypothetical protein